MPAAFHFYFIICKRKKIFDEYMKDLNCLNACRKFMNETIFAFDAEINFFSQILFKKPH